MKKMTKAFSLLEMIFSIVVISVIASIAIPKFMSTKDDAVVSTLKQDISTVTTSVQSYYLVNGKIDKISDAVNLNSSVWDISDSAIIYNDQSNECVKVEISSLDNDIQLILTVNEDAGSICEKLASSGMTSTIYKLR